MTDEVLPISALSFDPANPRLRTERSAHVIRSSLQRYGPLRSLVGQKLPDGRIVIRAGNGTLEEAGQVGIEKVRLIQRRADELVVVVADDLDEEKWIQYSVDDNRASDLSTWDPAILEQISQDIDLSNSFLEGELDELIESLAGLTEGLGEDELFEGETDPDDVPDFDEVETRVKKGDIWRLGRHRVMCGDSTVITDVERLMDGEKADLCFTSPPYNAGENSHINGDYYKDGGKKTFYEDHSKDTMSSADYILFCNIVLQNLFSITKQKGSVLWNTAYNANSRKEYGEIVFGENNPFSVQETIVWDKTSCFNISSKNILSRVCEFVFLLSSSSSYFTNQGDNEPWYNVWRISSTGSSHGGHRACFPVALPEKGIECFCPKKGLIIEPFLGSGTTLIAAEKTGRTCYGMELSEKYCDVILKRWEDFTGQTAERI